MSTQRRDSKGRVLRKGESQRKDGRYMYRYTDTLGNKQTVYSWTLTEKDKPPAGAPPCVPLREQEKEIEHDLYDGIRAKEAKTKTLDEQFEMFMKLRTDLRETTRCNYRHIYNVYVKNELGKMNLREIRYTDIMRLYIDLMQNRKIKFGTAQSVNNILSQLFGIAVKDELLRTSPTTGALVKVKKMFGAEKEKRHALTRPQQERFIEYVYGSKLYQKWGNLFTVLLGTGLRISEALGLRTDDCNFKTNEIFVTHNLIYKESEAGGYRYRVTGLKTAAGMRVIPMFKEVREALIRESSKERDRRNPQFEIDGYTNFIFLNSKGKPYTPGAVFGAIQNIVNDYNREEFFLSLNERREPCYIPKISAHILRHTFCTRLCEEISDIKVIQDVMGHKNSQTTMDIYNDVTKERKVDTFQRIDGSIKLA